MTTISIPFLDIEYPEPSPALRRTAPAVALGQPLTTLPALKPQFQMPAELKTATSPRQIAIEMPSFQPRNPVEISDNLRYQNQYSPGLKTADANETAPAVARLVDSILERFPLGAPTTLLFVGTEANPHTAVTCQLVATSLATRKIGDILLVDSSIKSELTHRNSLYDQRGLSNLLAHCEDWQACVHKLATSGLDFLPSGTTHWQNWGSETNLRKMSAEFKQRYQFVCVSAGDALHSNPKLWASVSDGTYLLVSLKNANPDIAQSSVAELQVSGARLLGCIVTDTDQST